MPTLEKRFKPTKIAFYQNPKDNIGPAEVRAATGCQLAINCCYFDMAASLMITVNGIKTRRPCGIFIWNDQEIRKEWNAAEGFGFDSNGAFDFGWSDQMSRHNFVYGDILINNKVRRDPLTVALGARRNTERTSISVMDNGDLLAYCTTDIISPAELQSRLYEKGAVTSLMLDGSASTQWSCADSTYKTARSFVPFWLCFWWEDKQMDLINNSKITAPALSKGSKGSSVKVLQAALNALGYSCGIADGDFGNKTQKALTRFQTARGIQATGAMDDVTWSALLN